MQLSNELPDKLSVEGVDVQQAGQLLEILRELHCHIRCFVSAKHCVIGNWAVHIGLVKGDIVLDA